PAEASPRVPADVAGLTEVFGVELFVADARRQERPEWVGSEVVEGVQPKSIEVEIEVRRADRLELCVRAETLRRHFRAPLRGEEVSEPRAEERVVLGPQGGVVVEPSIAAINTEFPIAALAAARERRVRGPEQQCGDDRNHRTAHGGAFLRGDSKHGARSPRIDDAENLQKPC